MTGRLIVCATPIGNLGDAPPRLVEALGGADLVYAEDTRRTRKLLSAFGIDVPLRSYYAGNERSRAAELDEELARGRVVALVTDAGTPAVSDPGASAVAVAAAAGAEVTVVPGPSAVTAALAVSGFLADRFVFEGFLPKKGKERTRAVAGLVTEARTAVVFLSPHRAGADLAELAGALGERRVVVARELTKLHEEVWRGTLEEAARRWGPDARGELTLVIEGAAPAAGDLEEAVAAASAAITAGARPSEAVRRAAADHGVSRRELYERVVGTEPG